MFVPDYLFEVAPGVFQHRTPVANGKVDIIENYKSKIRDWESLLMPMPLSSTKNST